MITGTIGHPRQKEETRSWSPSKQKKKKTQTQKKKPWSDKHCWEETRNLHDSRLKVGLKTIFHVFLHDPQSTSEKSKKKYTNGS